MDMKIAFIGLGNMGLPMAQNLARAGFNVCGFDLSAAQMEQLAEAGGQPAVSVAEAANAADVVITMLPASRHVESIYLGAGGVLEVSQPKTLFIDCSTISPDSARKLATAALQKNLSMIDAPVSGGTSGAQAGTLTFMVGGRVDDLEKARPLLEKMGKNIFHSGPNGSGQTVKVCNNMLLGILMAGTSEALQLGIANGMDPKVLSEIMAKSSGRNWVLEVYNPCPGVMEDVPSSRNYAGGFGVDLMLKDLGLAVENSLLVGASLPLGALTRNLYDLHSKSGNGALDFASIFNMLGKKD
jgi:3-hydroxyisobutyrate dehydrogenase